MRSRTNEFKRVPLPTRDSCFYSTLLDLTNHKTNGPSLAENPNAGPALVVIIHPSSYVDLLSSHLLFRLAPTPTPRTWRVLPCMRAHVLGFAELVAHLAYMFDHYRSPAPINIPCAGLNNDPSISPPNNDH
jgi:hypothetical protein